MIKKIGKLMLPVMLLTCLVNHHVEANSSGFVDAIGKNLNGETINIPVLNQDNYYYLLFNNKNNIIQIIELENEVLEVISNSENDFLDKKYAPYVTAYENINIITNKVYEKFERKGISNTEIKYVNIIFNNEVEKAIWTGENIAVNKEFVNSLDILAHEYIHSIIQNEVGSIKYTGEAGVLEESLADSFASIIDGNFTIGEGLGNDSILRSLSNPKQYNQPMHMDDYIYTEGEFEEVHLNNGIPNYAFYLTYNALGSEKTEQIYYYVLTNTFNNNSTFKSFKEDLIFAANSLYTHEDANKINDVWEYVGVE